MLITIPASSHSEAVVADAQRSTMARSNGAEVANGIADALWDWSTSRTRQFAWGRLARRVPGLPVSFLHRFFLVERPAYAYGVRKATELAAGLGHRGVTVIEFGVAGGEGLLALAAHADYYGQAAGVAVRVVGFDLGEGLPAPVDYRDLPYFYTQGFYAMDQRALLAKLGSAQLILGDVAETAERFVNDQFQDLATHPVGFVAFDLDYYSSTMAAFDLFRKDDPIHLLPRTTCYFDDLLGTIGQIGELRAVADFNIESADRVIGRLIGLRSCLPFDPPWADQVFQLHRFDHPDYGRLQPWKGMRTQLPLGKR